jgi:methylmalonyl-CoA mutase
MHLTAVSSRHMMAKRDPWTNMLRSTLACAGAALGGADAVTLLPFTWALGQADGFARRVARNIQVVLQEESSLGRVLDPTGGSWYVEKLTDDLAKKAWSLFQEIEAKGGIISALSSGYVQSEIAATAAARAKAVATGRTELTGVSAFPQLGDDGVTVVPHPAAPPLTEKQLVEPLTPHRAAEPFEALRDAADAHAAKTGKPPQVFLASIGAIIEHTARSTWTKNYLAAGGIEALTSDGYPDGAAAAEAFASSGATAACICSSDTLYAAHALAAARALKSAGARLVLMAGRPGERETMLKSAGVDQFLFAGADAVATLSGLQAKLGVAT